MTTHAAAASDERTAPGQEAARGTSFDSILTLASVLDATPGSHAVLLGAGISISAGVPSAWGVQQELIRRIARAEAAELLEEPHQWYEKRFGVEAEYGPLLEMLASTPDARQALMREFFEPESVDPEAPAPKPSSAHRSLARLAKTGKLRIFLTLNFDHLMEKALREVGIEPVVARTVEDLAGLPPLHTLRAVVVHLHGDYLSPLAMRNTDSELAVYGDGLDDFIARVLRDHALLAVGWSAEYDKALRALVDAHLLERYTSYWIDYAELQHEASALADRKKFVRIRGTADGKVGRLADAVAAIADRQARHPLSLTEAVTTAKRELGGNRVAISAHDRLREELTRLREHPDLHRPITELGRESYPQIVGRLIEASLIPAGLVAAAVYWGDERTDRWWFDDMRRFSADRSEDGVVRLLALPRLCGTMLYQAALVGSVAAGRFALSRQLLHATAERHSDQDKTLSQQLLAARNHAGNNAPSARALKALYPIFVEHLSLGERAYEEAWELADVLAMVEGLGADASLDARRNTLAAERRKVADARREIAEADNDHVEHARQRLREALEDEARALEKLAYLANVIGAHVRYTSRLGDHGVAPAVEWLLSEVRREGLQHPLVQAKFGDGTPEGLNVVLEAVSLAVGRLGTERAWQSLPPGGGAIPGYLWVDTQQVPAL
ncbi:SIR2 family protein [Myceligenerans salitolerans]|uniref:SIR2 family protein n=1 Tax=Myceligenerans salitolerans TaxID=1230528 RepID=A0ABS3IA43_9MICO|nr:SIR2 family protein [Myceligenerans salitolerans]MBO0609891.1 SIR2 family protein [Myceligenerans salitolerans]